MWSVMHAKCMCAISLQSNRKSNTTLSRSDRDHRERAHRRMRRMSGKAHTHTPVYIVCVVQYNTCRPRHTLVRGVRLSPLRPEPCGPRLVPRSRRTAFRDRLQQHCGAASRAAPLPAAPREPSKSSHVAYAPRAPSSIGAFALCPRYAPPARGHHPPALQPRKHNHAARLITPCQRPAHHPVALSGQA